MELACVTQREGRCRRADHEPPPTQNFPPAGCRFLLRPVYEAERVRIGMVVSPPKTSGFTPRVGVVGIAHVLPRELAGQCLPCLAPSYSSVSSGLLVALLFRRPPFTVCPHQPQPGTRVWSQSNPREKSHPPCVLGHMILTSVSSLVKRS